jgi:hypothetical protein
MTGKNPVSETFCTSDMPQIMDSVQHNTHITDQPLSQNFSESSKMYVLIYFGFEALTEVVIESSVFWDVTLCSPLKVNRRYGGTCRLHYTCFLLISCLACSSTLKMEATCSYGLQGVMSQKL